MKADADAKEGEVGYQFTQDQYVDETHRIRYKYLIIADGEVSAQYIDGIIYENGEPSVTINNKDETYDVTDQLTYPTSVTLNGKTYKVTEAKTSYVRAKQLTIPEGIETCQVLSSSPYVEHMTLPSTIKKINGGELVFSYSGIEEADLSNAENMNGRQAFLDCWNLKTVYIGKNTDFTGQKHYGSYLSIGVNPFLGCSGIEKFVEKEKNQNHLYVEDGKLYTSEIEGGLFEADSKDYVSRTYNL